MFVGNNRDIKKDTLKNCYLSNYNPQPPLFFKMKQNSSYIIYS